MTAPESEVSEPGPGEVYCTSCGEVIKEQAEVCPECGVRQKEPTGGQGGATQGDHDPGVVALLNFLIPGVGHMILGDVALGIGAFVGNIVLGVITIATLGLGLIIHLPFWGFIIYDGYKRAERQ